MGESLPIDYVARQQNSDDPMLYGTAYLSDTFLTYKLTGAHLRASDVLFLGSSRVMQFRSQMVNAPDRQAYNAGGGAYSFRSAEAFLRQLAERGGQQALPELVILGVDQAWVNGCLDYTLTPEADPYEPYMPIRENLNTVRRLARDILIGKVPISALFSPNDPVDGNHAFGVQAIVLGSGFRNDGSYQYAAVPPSNETWRNRFADEFNRIQRGSEPFEPCSELSNQILENDLPSFLDYVQQAGIQVVAFSPPFAPDILATLSATGGYSYLQKLDSSLAPIFESYGFAYFDFTDVSDLGLTDADYIDGFHGSERVYLRLWLTIVEATPSLLGTYVEVSPLQALDENSEAGQLLLFD